MHNTETIKRYTEKIIKMNLQVVEKNLKMVHLVLGILTKEIMTDGRDRFLYNYMVFAKKEIS